MVGVKGVIVCVRATQQWPPANRDLQIEPPEYVTFETFGQLTYFFPCMLSSVSVNLEFVVTLRLVSCWPLRVLSWAVGCTTEWWLRCLSLIATHTRFLSRTHSLALTHFAQLNYSLSLSLSLSLLFSSLLFSSLFSSLSLSVCAFGGRRA
jgi:hypothetical protein